MNQGRYYIQLAEDDNGHESDERSSYHLFDRHRVNHFREPYCLVAYGTYEECQQEQRRLLAVEAAGEVDVNLG